MKRRWRWPVIAAVLVVAYIIHRFPRETDTDYFDEDLGDALQANGVRFYAVEQTGNDKVPGVWKDPRPEEEV